MRILKTFSIGAIATAVIATSAMAASHGGHSAGGAGLRAGGGGWSRGAAYAGNYGRSGGYRGGNYGGRYGGRGGYGRHYRGYYPGFVGIGFYPWYGWYDPYYADYYPYGPYGYSGYGYGYDDSYAPGVVRGEVVARNNNGGSVVVRVQQRLARAGYYRGSIDGVMGPGTRRAIRSFERSNGLPVDGQIDNRLLSRLGMA